MHKGCVCASLSVCTYILIHHMFTYMHTIMQVYVCMSVGVSICVCACVYLFTYVFSIYTCACVDVGMFMHVHEYVSYVQILVLVCTGVHARAHVCVCVCMHMGCVASSNIPESGLSAGCRRHNRRQGAESGHLLYFSSVITKCFCDSAESPLGTKYSLGPPSAVQMPVS